MPLRCHDADREELAFLHDDASWEALRNRNKRENSLKLPCCGSDVTLKTSKLGTRFFSHKVRDECASAGESAEHLLAKRIIAEAALRCGWEARPEDRYVDGDGDCIVDVCCKRPGASKGIAFEVQWSRQAEEVTVARTERYARHGLRTLWLMKQDQIPVSRDVPAARLERTDSGFDVVLPSIEYNPRWMSPTTRKEPSNWGQRVGLSEFVGGVVRGQFVFGLAAGGTIPVDVYGGSSDCYRCRKVSTIIKYFKLRTDRLQPGLKDLTLSVAGLGEFGDAFERKMLSALGPNMASAGIAPIKRRYSNTVKDNYISNGCRHCGALYGRHYLYRLVDVGCLFRTEVEFSKEELDQISGGEFDRWFYLPDPDGAQSEPAVHQVTASAG